MNETVFHAWLQQPAVALALELSIAACIGLVAHAVLDQVVKRAAHRYEFLAHVRAHARGPSRLLMPVLLMQLALSNTEQIVPYLSALRHAASILVVLLVTLLCMRLVSAFAETVIARHPIDAADNLRSRRLHTQVRVFSRSAIFLIGLLGVGSVLMTFPNVRQVGVSILASAGVAGLVAGFAARPVLGSFISGLQIALTQPIRLDDVLIVEGEFGRVEEITSTYVVLKIWDSRRLIVPLEWFTTHPFQNWTRTGSDLLAPVYLWVDFRMPLQPLREELQRLAEADRDWDRRLAILQVTDTNERAMQLRALLSAQSSGQAWDLRCRIREGLIDFMQKRYPQHLPQQRSVGFFEMKEEHGGTTPPAMHMPAWGGAEGRA